MWSSCSGKNSSWAKKSDQVDDWELLELDRAKRCCVGDGMRVPVEETEDADEASSSRVTSGLVTVSNIGASAGSLASLDLAKDFWNSLMGFRCGWGHGGSVDGGAKARSINVDVKYPQDRRSKVQGGSSVYSVFHR